jgi:hypothetical protein
LIAGVSHPSDAASVFGFVASVFGLGSTRKSPFGNARGAVAVAGAGCTLERAAAEVGSGTAVVAGSAMPCGMRRTGELMSYIWLMSYMRWFSHERNARPQRLENLPHLSGPAPAQGHTPPQHSRRGHHG